MSAVCEFRVCPTGCVHMTFGSVTVHLGRQEFAAFAARAEQVARAIGGDAQGQQPQSSSQRGPLLGKAVGADFH